MSGSHKKKAPRKKSRSVAWKQRERNVAAFHGLVRNPLSGANSGRVGDCYDPETTKPWVYIECKHYEAHSAISILEKHCDQVRKVDKSGLCIAALSENRRHGFYVLIHSSSLLLYATELLNRNGFDVTRKEATNAAYDCLGDGEDGETDVEDVLALREVSDGDVL